MFAEKRTSTPNRRRLRWALRLTSLVALGLLAYGPLFVWLPVTPGFVRDRQDLVVILRRPGAAVTAAHGRLGAAARAVETSLGLSFTQPVPIVLCDAWRDLRRFMPWLPVNRGLGARTLPIGHVVFVTPLVRDRADADVFVRHELVHVLLHQHMPMTQRLDGGKPAWLIEGVATFFGNPGSYPAGEDLRDRAKAVDVGRLLTDGMGAPGGPTLFYAESRDSRLSREVCPGSGAVALRVRGDVRRDVRRGAGGVRAARRVVMVRTNRARARI